MNTVLIKLGRPLPELFGFKGGTPYYLLAEEASEGETILSLMRKLARTHPDFAAVAFNSDPEGKDTSPFIVRLNDRICSRTATIHDSDIVALFPGVG
ncbi:MAG: MoaD/ThiS family protein [Dehalococcoidia bacterium]|nr:MoaD/ThiS family protein [Dehalococcoidia bacterium]